MPAYHGSRRSKEPLPAKYLPHFQAQPLQSIASTIAIAGPDLDNLYKLYNKEKLNDARLCVQRARATLTNHDGSITYYCNRQVSVYP
jgi:hypothetical protein